MKVEMYKATPHGIRYWAIEPDYDGACLKIVHGKWGGSLQTKYEDVDENSSGRSLDEQIDLRVESRITSKRDIGYRGSVEKAKSAEGTNTLGYFRPMLAKPIDKLRDIDYAAMYLQMKYDGHRCLVTNTSTGLIAYSRNGRRIKTIDHILKGINIPIGVTIDGELYCHGRPLQTITSWAKRKQAGTSMLEYIVYDMVSKDEYHDRFNFINHYTLGDNARVAPTDKSVSSDHLSALLTSSIALGYEGLILRHKEAPYEVGKRSKNLIKVKQFMDAEFMVVDINPSADGWAILTCEVPESRSSFTVSAPGTMHQKMGVMRLKDEFIGKAVTVKFANYTKDGIPFHPVADRWKDEI